MSAPRAAWLGQVIEDALEPERPLLDAHHHLWEFSRNPYLPGDMLADMRGHNVCHNVRQSVFVECGAAYDREGDESLRPVGETRFVVDCTAAVRPGQARAPVLAAAIVGHANLQLGEAVTPVLQAHLAAAPGRFRAVRHSCTWDASEDVPNSHSGPPPSLYLRDDFRAGFAQLAPLGLHFEAWCYHTQLGELASLARAFPGTTIVLNHCGGPLGVGPYAADPAVVREHWHEGINELAACTNVMVKLGGLCMPINGFAWHERPRPPDSHELATALAPVFDACIAAFGTDRCLFESNFPVDKVSCSYTVLWNAFKRIAAHYSAAQQDGLLHDNALALYRLDPV